MNGLRSLHRRAGQVGASAFVASLLFSVPARAQPEGIPGAEASGARLAAKEVTPLHPPMQLRMISPEDGLPQSQVAAVAQDSRGFLWFGTQEGLARYDGEQFVVYRHVENESTSLPGSDIAALVVDAQDTLWVGTDKGLARYDDRVNNFVVIKAQAAEADLGVKVLFASHDGIVWVGTESGLYTLTPGANLLQPTSVLAPVVAAARASDGGAWVVTLDEGNGTALFKVGPDGKSKTVPVDHELSPLSAVFEDSQKRLWLGTEGIGLVLSDAGGATKQRFRAGAAASELTDDRIHVIYEDRQKSVWIGTAHGLNRYDEATRTFTRFARGTTAATTSFPQGVESLLEDRVGRLWIGTVSGLRVHDPYANRLAHFRPDDFVTGLAVDEAGSIWANTYSSGLFKYDRDKSETTIYRSIEQIGGGKLELAGHWLTAITVSRSGVIWLSGEQLGLVRFDPKREVAEVFGLRHGDVENPRINYIHEADNGELWLATFGSGLVRFDPKSGAADFLGSGDGAQGTSLDYLYMILPDVSSNGGLLLGGVGGVVRFTPGTGTTTLYAPRPGDPSSLSHEYAISLYQAPGGDLWVGTYNGGLNFLPAGSKQFQHITTKDGLSNDTIYGILPDPSGALWLSTNGGGLIRFDPKSREVRRFYVTDGVQGNEFIQLSFAASAAGELLFGGTNGFNAFVPSKELKELDPPAVVLTGVKLFNEDATLATPPWHLDDFEIDHDSVVTFDFAAPPDARGVHYAYKLEGLHSDWIETDASSVTLSNLEGGDYELLIRAANRRGVWSEKPMSIRLAVNPPFWKSRWALGIYVLAVGVAGATVWQYQRRRLEGLRQANRLAAAERDLEITGTIQSGFLPSENPIMRPSIQLVGLYRPAGAASGDWWWFEESARAQTILVGDVTGHGPGPAIVTAAVATAFRVMGQEEQALTEKLRRVNREVLAASQGKFHVVLSTVEIEPDGSFTFLSAGGLPMVQVSPGQERAKVVHARGTPLGTKDFKVGSMAGSLALGDRGFLFSDGIVEQKMSDGRDVGMRRVSRLFQKAAAMPLHEAAKLLFEEVDQLRQNSPQEDDWTIVMFEWRA